MNEVQRVSDGDFFDSLELLTEEEARVLWTWGGFGEPEAFPGVRLAVLQMVQAVTSTARRWLGRYFASLAPHSGVRAVLALLGSRRSRFPARIPVPVPAPVRMTSQRQRSTVAPSRGSPWRAGVGEAPT